VPLTIAQKSNVRRHLGFGTVGLPVLNPAGGSFYDSAVGQRYFEAYGFLEWRMDTLNPDEESRVTGYAYGATLLTGNTQTGDTVTLTVSGGPLTAPVVLTTTAGSQDTALTLAVTLAALANQNLTLAANRFYAVAPWGSGPFSYRPAGIPLSEMAILSPVPFTLAVTSTGSTGAAITANGIQLHPKAVLIDPLTNISTPHYGYLSILDQLETATVGSSDNLSTLKADVWTARHDETQQREELYNLWRYKLSRDLAIPLWEDTPEARSSGGQVWGGSAAVL
jgi:hypothetical protein